MKRIAFLILTVGLLPAVARGQQGPSPIGVTDEFIPVKSADRRAMYEDIEIMRRLLSRTLATRPALSAQCTACHTANVQFHNDLWSDMNPDIFTKNTAGRGAITADFDGDGLLDLYVVNNVHPHIGAIPFAIEGSYLRNYGVVYHLTLPQVAREELSPGGPVQPPKRSSEWDQVRGEVRGQSTPPVTPAKKFTLVDALLQVLADNGKNFAQLPANENLTLILTFRGAPAASGSPHRFGGKTGMMGGMGPGGAGKPSVGSDSGAGISGPRGPGMMGGNSGGGPSGAYFPANEPATPDREFEMLGDLHLKQGKLQEAASAYERALAKARDGLMETRLPPSPARLEAKERARIRFDELTRKLADVRLQMNDLDGARKALELRSADTGVQTKNVAPTQPQPAAIKLPSKLILTVSKRLLDQVGSGAMTFAEFQKQVSLEMPDLDAPAQK